MLLQAGIRHIYCHICGEQNKNLPLWHKIPMGNPGIVSFGHEVDIDTAIKFFGERCIIAGNIEPAIIHLGTPDQIYNLCREALAKGIKAPRAAGIIHTDFEKGFIRAETVSFDDYVAGGGEQVTERCHDEKAYRLGQDSDTAGFSGPTDVDGALRSRYRVSGAGSAAGRSPQS